MYICIFMQNLNLPTWLFCTLVCCLLIFFKINFFEKFFKEYHQHVKQFETRSAGQFAEPDLGPNYVQKLSADNTYYFVLLFSSNFRIWRKKFRVGGKNLG